MSEHKRIGYADPPYPGCAHKYGKDGDPYTGEVSEVDHAKLIQSLENDYDGWVLHTHEPGLRVVVPLLPKTARVMVWVKPFAAFKPNVPLAYAWEPVIVKPARKQVVSGRMVMRDWVSANITMMKGMPGVKPDAVCRWAFECVGAEPQDELVDLFPGSGAVGRAWDAWCSQLTLGIA